MRSRLFLLLCAFLVSEMVLARGADEVVVASKKFTESVILADIASQALISTGVPARHQRELGGTRLIWQALLQGEVDLYPEYTGTIHQERLGAAKDTQQDLSRMRAALAAQGVVMSEPLGFNNSYALGMLESQAERLGVAKVSDLRWHRALKLGFSEEFMQRADGWPGLRTRYSLPQIAQGLDHDLAYRGLAAGDLDVVDLYTTDAEFTHYHLRALEDDLHYFPDYQAVLLYRADLPKRKPAVTDIVQALSNGINAQTMQAMNAKAKLNKVPEVRIAADFLREKLGITTDVQVDTRTSRLLRYTREHLQLVGISLGAAIILAVPLGIGCAHSPRLGQVILGVAGVLQTLPSLALFVFLIPVLGIGAPPAIAALFVYSLLPILRNTCMGLRGITRSLRESADALGLDTFSRLRLIDLPLASPAILAGIKTSAVINIGTATIGAVIGAGGYGQPILTGIRLDDYGLILEGAIPAAIMALSVQGLFDLAEIWLVPRGLRLATHR